MVIAAVRQRGNERAILAFASRQTLGEREQLAVLDDVARERHPSRAVNSHERQRLAGLQAQEHVVVAHEHALIDVVAA